MRPMNEPKARETGDNDRGSAGFSAVRFADCFRELLLNPSDKSLGYFRSSAARTKITSSAYCTLLTAYDLLHRITLIPGDGIGPEVASAVVRIIEASGVQIEWGKARRRPGGAR